MKFIKKELAIRYVKIHGGKISSLSFVSEDGVFDTLRDRNGKLIAVIKEYQLPHPLIEMQSTNTLFEFEQLEVDCNREIIFDLVNSGTGSLFIYEIYLDGYRIGSAFSKSNKMKRHDYIDAFVNTGEKNPAFFYSVKKVFDNEEEARKESQTKREHIYMFDEYWWDDDTCDNAWFPTFDTLEQLLNYHYKFEKEIGLKE